MITVVMTTYAPEGDGAVRAGYARRTLKALITNLRAPEPLRLHVADDGSADDRYIGRLLETAQAHWKTEGSTTSSNRRGIGASLNKALSSIDGPWLYITDDWLLTQPLHLAVPVQLMEEQGYDLVRIGPPHPNLRCKTRFEVGIGWWLELDQSFGGFAFATRPFLASKRFCEQVGPFVEGADAYDTERDYAERVKATSLKLAYYDQSFNGGGPWEHIGEYEVGKVQI